MNIDWKALSEKFHPDDIDWRIQESGSTKDGKVWAKVIPYVTSRAVQQRLDDVVGPANWRNEFREWLVGDQAGVLCGISIRVDGEWVTKWDGAGCTHIEPIKGGFSDATKRAAVQWGLARYLYYLEAYFAQIVDKGTKGAYYAGRNTKKNLDAFYWLPPQLPLDSIPAIDRSRALEIEEPTTNGHHHVDAPRASADGNKALSALANLRTSRDKVKLAKFSNEIRLRIEAGQPYTAGDVKLLEKAIADAEHRCGQGTTPDETDEKAIVAKAIEDIKKAHDDMNRFRVDEIYDQYCGPDSTLSEAAMNAVAAEHKKAKESLGPAPRVAMAQTKKQANLLETHANAGQ